jgi:hypothetical protein
MNVLRRLWAALGALADNVAALAETAREINGALRQRDGLDGNETAAPAFPNGTACPGLPAVSTHTTAPGGTENAEAPSPPVGRGTTAAQ